MGVIKRGVETMFDERPNDSLTTFIPEWFRIIPFVAGETPQVAGVPAGDLRADPVSCFFVVVL